VPYFFNHLDIFREALKESPFGLFTDVDGTISHVVPTPQQAMVSRLCCHYLSCLCHHLALVAVISGRPAIEVRKMLNIDGIIYIGNHGLERWSEGHSKLTKGAQDYSEVIKAAIDELTQLITVKNIHIENKGITASIHYRLSPEPRLAERDILAAIKQSPHTKSLRIIQEKMAIDLLPPVETNKGTAILDLIQEYNLKGSIYLGDDLTDVDAFRAIHAARHNFNFRGFALGITSPEMPEKFVEEVDFTLNGVDDVERFLKWMFQSVLELSQ